MTTNNDKKAWCAGAVCSALILSGCDGLSKVGEQDYDDTPPQAVVTVIGQPSTATSDKVTVRMRSGAELTLSGKDSEETIAPILRFEWQRQNSAAQQLKIVQRTSNTIAFQIPQVAQQTTLALRLLVTDSNGATDTQEVDVIVEPIGDPNQFLSYLGAPTTFSIVAVSSADLPPCTTQGQQGCLAVDTPFLIEVETRAQYWDIEGRRNEDVVVDRRTFEGAWLASLGASSNCSGLENPKFIAPIPAFDGDDIAAAVQSSNPNRVVDFSRIDDATLLVTARISQPANSAVSLPAGERQVCISEFETSTSSRAGAKFRLQPQLAPDGAATQVQFTTDELIEAVLAVSQEGAAAGDPAPLDTRASAEAYYRTIDRTDIAQQKSSFIGWLKANGFLPANHGDAIDWAAVARGADAKATYVNNFDLGFGRDMYVRRLRCSHAGPNFQPGECDIASVVVNYGSLEGAAKKLSPQLAVAMEYSRTDPNDASGRRFVKFYTYAPDVRCNLQNQPAGGCTQFRRVGSANLDGRGEKFMPGACTICHGGTPLQPGAPAAGEELRYSARNADAPPGDVNAAFLPWDLKSFLFSDDAQAGFPDDPVNATHHQLWLDTRKSVQEPNIKSLNQLVALTYVDPTSELNRYELPRQLVTGWYSGSGGAFNANFVPQQWNTDADQRSLYLDVFAQYCRTCHVAHVPNVSTTGGQLDPLARCDTASATQPYAGSRSQIAFGCYHQFVHAGALHERLAQGVMPAARLTSDRFWVGASPPAAQALAEHLGVAVASLAFKTVPFLEEAQIKLTPSSTPVVLAFNGAGEMEVAKRGAVVRPLGTLQGGLPPVSWQVTDSQGTALSVAGANTLSPSFKVNVPGSYTVRLTAGGESVTRVVALPNFVPIAANSEQNISPGATSARVDVLASGTVGRAGGAGPPQPIIQPNSGQFNGDGPYSISVCAAGTTAQQCTSGSLQTSLAATVTVVSDATLTPARQVLTYVPGGVGLDSFSYRITDGDGDPSIGTISARVTAALQTSDQTECADSSGQRSFALAVSGGTPPFAVTFSDPLGLTANGGQGLSWTFNAAALPSTPTRQVFIGDVAKTYAIVDSSVPAQRDDAVTLNVRVLPRQPWTRTAPPPVGSPAGGVSTVWASTGCTGCHRVGGIGAAFRLDDAVTLYTNVTREVDRQTPTSSDILRCPTRNAAGNCGSLGAGTNHPNTALAVDDATYIAILRWIQEGAALNSDERTGCSN